MVDDDDDISKIAPATMYNGTPLINHRRIVSTAVEEARLACGKGCSSRLSARSCCRRLALFGSRTGGDLLMGLTVYLTQSKKTRAKKTF